MAKTILTDRGRSIKPKGNSISYTLMRANRSPKVSLSPQRGQRSLSPRSNECSICYENLATHISIKMHCSHTFHCLCVGKWFEESNKNYCPICREPNVYNNELDIVIDNIIVKLAYTKHALFNDLNKIISILQQYSLYYNDDQKGKNLYLALMVGNDRFIKTKIEERLTSLLTRGCLRLNPDKTLYEYIN